jgi:hypothetical protein
MNNQFKRCYESLEENLISDLDSLLGEISIMEVDDLDTHDTELLKGWYAVVNTDGIIAYFGEEAEAFRFRLDYINRLLNN